QNGTPQRFGEVDSTARAMAITNSPETSRNRERTARAPTARVGSTARSTASVPSSRASSTPASAASATAPITTIASSAISATVSTACRVKAARRVKGERSSCTGTCYGCTPIRWPESAALPASHPIWRIHPMTDPGSSTGPATRVEHDLLGEREVPAEAYYGVQTLRAQENFHISGVPLSHFPLLIPALAQVKRAAARANNRLGVLDDERAAAIETACEEIVGGALHEHFVVDVIQGGAGTSTNMNANEVIANRALEILGHERGQYEHLHPNNHVNLGQSTNDVYPTAIRLTMMLSFPGLTEAMDRL